MFYSDCVASAHLDSVLSHTGVAIEDKSYDIIDMLKTAVGFDEHAICTEECLQKAFDAKDLANVMRILDEGLHVVDSSTLVMRAVISGSFEIFRYLQQTHHLVVVVDAHNTAQAWMVAAARSGSLPVFRHVCDAVKGELTTRTEVGMSLLHLACTAGSVELVSFLLEKGLDINDDQTASKESPLCCAVSSGSLAVVKHLIAEGGKPDIVLSVHSNTYPRASLLHLAAFCNHHEVLSYLLSADGCYLELRDAATFTPLHRAALTGKPDCVRVLLDYGADVNTQVTLNDSSTGHGGMTPLMMASLLAADESVTLLLQHNADCNMQSGQGHPALYYAVPQVTFHGAHEDCYTAERYARAVRVVGLLLARPDLRPDLRETDTRWDTCAIHQCVLLGHAGIAQLFD